jgi:hypothetical protein
MLPSTDGASGAYMAGQFRLGGGGEGGTPPTSSSLLPSCGCSSTPTKKENENHPLQKGISRSLAQLLVHCPMGCQFSASAPPWLGTFPAEWVVPGSCWFHSTGWWGQPIHSPPVVPGGAHRSKSHDIPWYPVPSVERGGGGGRWVCGVVSVPVVL